MSIQYTMLVHARRSLMRENRSALKNGNNRAIRLPRDMDFEGVSELEISREGDTLILRPVKPSWDTFLLEGKADADFMVDRQDVVEEGRFEL